MEAIEGILYGFTVILSFENLLAAVLGALFGTAVGVLPGLGPVGGIALILPLTFGLSPVTGIVALGAIYYGAMYGGSTTSILLKIPGDAAAVVTTIDGYEFTKKGRAGQALFIVALASCVGATLSIIGMMFATPWLSGFALAFGSAEYLAITVVGLALLATITGGSIRSSVVMISIGLLIGTIGFDAVNGNTRYTFGTNILTLGFDLVPVAVGLFGLAEIFSMIENHASASKPVVVRLREMIPTKQELKRSVPSWLRGTGVGFSLGLIPGPSPTLATFISYRVEQMAAPSRIKPQFGKGAVEGIAGPEAANNAAATSSFVPLLALGLPFTPTLALILAVMYIQGIQPGPLLIQNHPDVFWGVIASLYIGNLILLILNIPLIGMWVSLLRVPRDVLIGSIVAVIIIGVFTVRNSMFDVYVALAFGIIGYFLKKIGVSPIPFLLALVLGPIIEKHLLEGLYLSSGNFGYFVQSPIAISIWAVGALGLILPKVWKQLRTKKLKK